MSWNPLEEFGHCSVQRRQKTKPCPDPRECWDLGTGLRTQAKELMGLLEAHTVVSAKAKLAGSKPTLREVEADLRRGEAGARQLSSTTQETHFSPVRNPGVSHPLWVTGCGEQWLHKERVGYNRRKPLRQVLYHMSVVLHEEDIGIQTYRGRHVQTDG